jgi:hypothetical protein
MENTEPKQVYGVKLDFVSERTIKDIIIMRAIQYIAPDNKAMHRSTTKIVQRIACGLLGILWTLE